MTIKIIKSKKIEELKTQDSDSIHLPVAARLPWKIKAGAAAARYFKCMTVPSVAKECEKA